MIERKFSMQLNNKNLYNLNNCKFKGLIKNKFNYELPKSNSQNKVY